MKNNNYYIDLLNKELHIKNAFYRAENSHTQTVKKGKLVHVKFCNKYLKKRRIEILWSRMLQIYVCMRKIRLNVLFVNVIINR